MDGRGTIPRPWNHHHPHVVRLRRYPRKTNRQRNIREAAGKALHSPELRRVVTDRPAWQSLVEGLSGWSIRPTAQRVCDRAATDLYLAKAHLTGQRA